MWQIDVFLKLASLNDQSCDVSNWPNSTSAFPPNENWRFHKNKKNYLTELRDINYRFVIRFMNYLYVVWVSTKLKTVYIIGRVCEGKEEAQNTKRIIVVVLDRTFPNLIDKQWDPHAINRNFIRNNDCIQGVYVFSNISNCHQRFQVKFGMDNSKLMAYRIQKLFGWQYYFD